MALLILERWAMREPDTRDGQKFRYPRFFFWCVLNVTSKFKIDLVFWVSAPPKKEKSDEPKNDTFGHNATCIVHCRLH
jgi:hypothetical protein